MVDDFEACVSKFRHGLFPGEHCKAAMVGRTDFDAFIALLRKVHNADAGYYAGIRTAGLTRELELKNGVLDAALEENKKLRKKVTNLLENMVKLEKLCKEVIDDE